MDQATVPQWRAWVMALRLPTLPLMAAPVLLGAAVAHRLGEVARLPTAVALTAALLIQAAANLANDYQDGVRGTDDHDRKGPTRVVQSGLIPPRRVRGAAVGLMALAALCGLYLVAHGGWPILAIGLTALLSAWLYTGGPWPLGYHGLGDPLVLVYFGPVAVAGTAYLSLGAFPWQAAVAGLVPGALATGVLVVNNLRDLEGDAMAGKRTLAVRLGAGPTKAYYAVLVTGALAVAVALGGWSPWAPLALAAAPLALPPLKRVLARQDLNHALVGTVRLTVAATLLLAAGVVL